MSLNQPRPSTHALPVLAMLVGMVAVSTAGPVILLAQVGPFALPSWRLLSVAAILLPVAAPRLLADLRGLTGTEKFRLALSGILYGLHFAFFTWAFEHTSKESAVVLLGAQPLMAAVVGALWLKEPITRWVAFSGAVAVAGIALFGWNDSIVDPRHLLGDGMVLLCGLLIVFSYAFGRRLRPRMSLTGYLTLLYLIGGLTCLAVALVSGDPLWGYSTESWIFVLCAILVPTLVGHSMFHYAVKYVPVFYVNLAILGEPVIALGIMIALKDHFAVFTASSLTLLQGLGAVLLLTGVGCGMVAARRHRTGD